MRNGITTPMIYWGILALIRSLQQIHDPLDLVLAEAGDRRFDGFHHV
jgi:hypothetical protein